MQQQAPLSKAPQVNIPTSVQFTPSRQDVSTLNEPSETLDVAVMEQLIDWTENMIKRTGNAHFLEVLEFFTVSGHISEKVKDILLLTARLSSTQVELDADERPDVRDYLLDLYTLQKVLKPENQDMDSKVLSLLLNRHGLDKR